MEGVGKGYHEGRVRVRSNQGSGLGLGLELGSDPIEEVREG